MINEISKDRRSENAEFHAKKGGKERDLNKYREPMKNSLETKARK